jgi:hypothetical protein
MKLSLRILGVILPHNRSCDNALGIGTVLRANQQTDRISSPDKVKNCFHIVQTHIVSYLVGIEGTFPWELKRSEHKTGHLTRSRKRRSVHSLPIRLHGLVLN